MAGMALDVLEQQRGRFLAADEVSDRRSFEIGIDFRGDALEFAERLRLLEPGIEIAGVGSARNLLCLSFRRLRFTGRAHGDAHVHIRLPLSCRSTEV
jgi:hypothetical protein